jgi:hypothetical protein
MLITVRPRPSRQLAGAGLCASLGGCGPYASRWRNAIIPPISAIAAYIANTPNPVHAENRCEMAGSVGSGLLAKISPPRCDAGGAPAPAGRQQAGRLVAVPSLSEALDVVLDLGGPGGVPVCGLE